MDPLSHHLEELAARGRSGRPAGVAQAAARTCDGGIPRIRLYAALKPYGFA